MSQDQQPDGSVRRSRRNWTLPTLDRHLAYVLAYDGVERRWEVEPIGVQSEVTFREPVRRDTPTA